MRVHLNVPAPAAPLRALIDRMALPQRLCVENGCGTRLLRNQACIVRGCDSHERYFLCSNVLEFPCITCRLSVASKCIVWPCSCYWLRSPVVWHSRVCNAMRVEAGVRDNLTFLTSKATKEHLMTAHFRAHKCESERLQRFVVDKQWWHFGTLRQALRQHSYCVFAYRIQRDERDLLGCTSRQA